MGEITKKVVALLVLLGNVTMILPANQIDSTLSAEIIKKSYFQEEQNAFIEKNELHIEDKDSFNKLNFHDSYNVVEHNSFDESLYLIQKSDFYRELQEIKKDLLKGEINDLTKDQLVSLWNQKVNQILKNHTLDLSENGINDFYNLEKEIFNSILDEYLYDQKSLRRESDENSASYFVSILSEDVLRTIDEDLNDLSVLDNLSYESVDVERINLDKENWFNDLSRKIDEGLEKWNEAERKFLMEKEEWKFNNDLQFEKDVKIWNEAYEQFKEKKELWKKSLEKKIEDSSIEWNEKLKELNESIQKSNDNITESILAEYNQKMAVIEADYNMIDQLQKLIDISNDGIEIWFENWKGVFPELEERWIEKTDRKELLISIEREKENFKDNIAVCKSLETLENWLISSDKYMELKKEYISDLSFQYSGNDLYQNESCEYKNELKKVQALKSYWEDQVQINEALYEYSINRTSSADIKEKTLNDFNNAKELYEKTNTIYQTELLKLKELATKYEDSRLKYENQKQIVKEKLESYEDLQKKYNDIKYDLSVTELSELKKKIIDSVNSINSVVYSASNQESVLNEYLMSLRNTEYVQILSKAEQICNILSDKQMYKADEKYFEIESIEKLEYEIERKKINGEEYLNELTVLENKKASIEYIQTGTIDVKKYETEIDLNKIAENFEDVCITLIKEKDGEILNELFCLIDEGVELNVLYEKLDGLRICNCSSYILTALDLYINQLSKKDDDISSYNNDVSKILDSNVEIFRLNKNLDSYKNVFNFLSNHINDELNAGLDLKTDYLSELNKDEKKYNAYLEKLVGLLNEYNGVNEKYHSYAGKIDNITRALEEAELIYNRELNKILPDGENNLYEELDSVFNEYSTQLQILNRITDEYKNAQLKLNIAENIKSWAENEYLHVGEEEVQKLKSKYEDSIEKLKYCKILENELSSTTKSKLNEFENDLIKEYEESLKTLFTFEVLVNEINEKMNVQKEKILSLKQEEYNYLSNILSEYDENQELKDNFEVSDMVSQFVKVEKTTEDDSNCMYTVSFSDEGIDRDCLKEYVLVKNAVTYQFDDSVILNSRSYIDSKDFLKDLESKDYNIEDLLLASCYLKYTNNHQWYFEGENPELSENYPLGIPTNELLGFNFSQSYLESRKNELKKAYEKIADLNGLDDIAKFLIYSNYNFNSELELEKREIDVIAYRGLQSVIDDVNSRASQFEVEAFGYSAGIGALFLIACLPWNIGAWALVPISVLSVALSSCLVSADSLREAASDIRNVQSGYSEIVEEYNLKYNELTGKYIYISNKLIKETDQFNKLCFGSGEDEYSYDDFVCAVSDLTGNPDFIESISIENKSIKTLMEETKNTNLSSVISDLYKKATLDFNLVTEKVKGYYNRMNLVHDSKLQELNEIELSLLPMNNLLLDFDCSQIVEECYGEKSWNKVLFLQKLNEACDAVYEKTGSYIDPDSNYYDFCFSFKDDFLEQILNVNYTASIAENDFEALIKKNNYYTSLNDWNDQVELTALTGEKQWFDAENRLYDEYDSWKTKWEKDYLNTLEEINLKYGQLVDEKNLWLQNQYFPEIENSYNEYQIENIITELDELKNEASIKINSVFESAIVNEIDDLSSIFDSLNISNFNLYNDYFEVQDKLTYVNPLDKVNSQIYLLENEMRKSSSSYAALIAENMINARIHEIENTVKSENEKMTKWQMDLVRKDGYIVDDEIYRYAVVDSTVFQNSIRKKQTVHKYRWFEMKVPELSIDKGNIEYLDSYSINQIIENKYAELNLLYERIFGFGSSGEFYKHVGFGPEFVENVDLKKSRFENISKNGSGELGEIMLDFIWNSIENSEGYAQLGTPLYDKKLTRENTIFGIELPSIRTLTDIVCAITSNISGQKWFDYFDDIIYGIMDVETNNKSLNEMIAAGVKIAASAAINSAASSLTSMAGNIASFGGQVLAKSGIKAASSYLTSVASNFFESVDYTNGFTVDWDKVNNGWIDQNTILNSLTSFGTETIKIGFNKGLNDFFLTDGTGYSLNSKVFDVSGMNIVNSNIANLSGAAFEYAVTGKTKLNILSANNLGMKLEDDIGLFELDFGKSEVTGRVGMNGTSVNIPAILKALPSASDSVRIFDAKVQAEFGNITRLGILNGINAAANSGLEIGVFSAKKVWNGDINLSVENMDVLGWARDSNIGISDKFLDNNKDAAAQFASLLVHECAHVAGADEFQARVSGYETYSKLKELYVITDDLYQNDSDIYVMTEILETAGKEGLFGALFTGDAFNKSEDSFDYYLMKTEDIGIRQTDGENIQIIIGESWTKAMVEEYNESCYRKNYNSYIDDEFSKYVEMNPDCEMTREEFINEGIAKYSDYSAFKNELIVERRKDCMVKPLADYNFSLENYMTVYGYGCVLTTVAYAAYTANGTLKTLNEVNEIVKNAGLFTSQGSNQSACISYGENYRKAVNLVAGDNVLISFERVNNSNDMVQFIENIEKSEDAYICIARVINDSHATMLKSQQARTIVNEKGETALTAISVIDPWGYRYKGIGRDTYDLSEVSNITAYKVDFKHRKKTLYEQIVQKQNAVW